MKNFIKVLGIDPGMTTAFAEVGYHMKKEKIEYMEINQVTTNQNDELEEKLRVLDANINYWFTLLSHANFDFIAMEENFMPRGTSTNASKVAGVIEANVGHWLHSVWNRPHEEEIFFLRYPPSSIKKALLGKGNGNISRRKFTEIFLEMIGEWELVIGEGTKAKRQHRIDALAVALACLVKTMNVDPKTFKRRTKISVPTGTDKGSS